MDKFNLDFGEVSVIKLGQKEEQEKTVIPSKEPQEVKPDDKTKTLSKVIVEPIPSEYIIPSGEITITEQGTFDIKDKAIAVVTAPFDSKFDQLINGTLTEVTAEDLQGNTKVNDYAFYNQRSLRTVTLPNTIQEIGTSAFQDCVNLSELNLDNNIIYIGDRFIAGCKNLNLTYIQPPTTQISARAFSGASGVVILAIGGLLNKNFGTCVDSASNTKLVKFNEEVTVTGNLYNNTGQPLGCIYDFPTTILSINTVGTGDYQFNFTVIRAVNPPTLAASNNLGNTKPRFVPYESIEQYKSATNWSAKANYIYPFVYNLEDLANIDTTKYTKALHIVDKDVVSLDNYAIYNYTDGTWIKGG